MRIRERLRSSQALSLSVLLLAIACDSGSGPTKTEVFSGVFRFGGDRFEIISFHGTVEASLTWTVPTEGTHPVARLSFWNPGLPGDTLLSESAPSATPPVIFSGSGFYIWVEHLPDQQGIAPIPYALTVTGR